MKKAFNLYCQNGGIVTVSHIIQKDCGLIAVGKVITNDDVSKGEMVGIKTDGSDAIFDKIKRIEINHEEVASVGEGNLIGVCLDNISKDELVNYFK